VSTRYLNQLGGFGKTIDVGKLLYGQAHTSDL
jgi:hypothetical protein